MDIELFVQRLMSLDFCYLDFEYGLIGESWWLDIELSGPLNSQGMILDFSELKKKAKQWINAEFDHRLLLPAHHPSLNRDAMQWRLSNGRCILYQGPDQSWQWIESTHINTEAVAKQIESGLKSILAPHRAKIYLYPDDHPFYFQYSHGLKHHQGNCQRIAHGHRARLSIEQDGHKKTDLEKNWRDRLHRRYIGSKSDLTIKQDQYQFTYQSSQGLFSLSLPSSHCYLLPTETTIENMAAHIATELKKEWPNSHFKVQLYEGIDKGATVRL